MFEWLHQVIGREGARFQRARLERFLNSAVTPSDGDNLFHPTLSADRSTVHAGETITLNGLNFPLDRATRAAVQWNDTVSGPIDHSELEISVNGGPPKPVPVPRRTADLGNTFVETSLAPKSHVVIRVRDCDRVTCTPFSNTVEIVTSANETLALSLETNGVSVALPSVARPDTTGAFTVAVTIPSGTSAGVRRLSASFGGGSAGLSITVLPDAQPLLREPHQVDPVTGQIINAFVEPNQTVGIRGDGFLGRASITIGLNFGNILNRSIALAETDEGGSFRTSFKWPADSPGGVQQISALLLSIPPQVVATLDVLVELQPE